MTSFLPELFKIFWPAVWFQRLWRFESEVTNWRLSISYSLKGGKTNVFGTPWSHITITRIFKTNRWLNFTMSHFHVKNQEEKNKVMHSCQWFCFYWYWLTCLHFGEEFLTLWQNGKFFWLQIPIFNISSSQVSRFLDKWILSLKFVFREQKIQIFWSILNKFERLRHRVQTKELPR